MQEFWYFISKWVLVGRHLPLSLVDKLFNVVHIMQITIPILAMIVVDKKSKIKLINIIKELFSLWILE